MVGGVVRTADGSSIASDARAVTSIGIDIVDPHLQASVAQVMAMVEAELRSSVLSADPFVTEAARHLVEAGGKRFRPLLVALGAHFGDAREPLVVPAAVVMELTHLATLYHDDVMDEAPVRRGAPSANSRWTNSVAILVGDYLFARAADLAADLGIECTVRSPRPSARVTVSRRSTTICR
jgi:heptaprenyl diphosphate synthase